MPSEYVLDYIDQLVAIDIEDGLNGVEYIGINPMWRSAWKKYWRSIVRREQLNPTAEYSDAKPSVQPTREDRSQNGERSQDSNDSFSESSQDVAN